MGKFNCEPDILENRSQEGEEEEEETWSMPDLINTLLCDELLSEILLRLTSPSDRKSVTLVCRRWLHLEARIKSSLGLCVPPDSSPLFLHFTSSLHLLLSRYSALVTLTLVSEGEHHNPPSLDLLLSHISSSCPHLRHLRFLAGPVTAPALRLLSSACASLTMLELVALPAHQLPVLATFPNLIDLSLTGCLVGETADLDGVTPANLPLTRLSLEGIGARNSGLGWLWRSCTRLRRLELFGCQGIGDTSVASLETCFASLEELRLRRCRFIATQILFLAADHCRGLRSLVYMDGGDMVGLHRVVRSCPIETLELRLPLDLFNEDLAVIAQSCRRLRSLRLYSCWMATGAGFKLLGSQMRGGVEELVLVRCRAIVQDAGTLAYLGQDLRGLQRLDVSENDHLADREMIGFLMCSCDRLVHLRVRRCRKLTDRTAEFIGQRCKALVNLVISSCDGMSAAGVVLVLAGCTGLKRLWVERDKVCGDASRIASSRGVVLPGVEPNPSDY